MYTLSRKAIFSWCKYVAPKFTGVSPQNLHCFSASVTLTVYSQNSHLTPSCAQTEYCTMIVEIWLHSEIR